ncbi:MAG: radical SAM protein [Calditrichaeota bacterium]|nr:MAG: radical SAM protein [Calditrichota bacterium]
MPHVLLINPWITDFAAYDFWLKPLGLLYIGAVLKEAGYEISLIDCLDRYDEELLEYQQLREPRNRFFKTGKFHREIIEKPHIYRDVPRNYARYGLPLSLFRSKLSHLRKPDVVLVTSGMTYWYPGVQQAINEIRQQWPDVPVALGGIYATLCREHAIQHSGADFVVSGEAELKALQLVDSLCGIKREYKNFPTSLDALPWPAFDLYDRLGFATILTSRGCPLSCSFCASRIVSGPYRWRYPENVVHELEYYVKKLCVDEIAFYDDALLTNYRRHLSVILEKILAINLPVNFHTPNGLQCKLIQEDIAELMYRANFKTIRLSYESANPERQKFDMSKKVSNESFVRAVNNLYKAGYKTGELDAYVMIALPGQTLEEMLWSMAFVHAQGVKIRLATFSPIPGTMDYQRAIEQGLITENTDPLLTNNSIVPIKPKGTNYHTFEKINLLAKGLNQELLNGQIYKDVASLVKYLKRHFTHEEIGGQSNITIPSLVTRNTQLTTNN